MSTAKGILTLAHLIAEEPKVFPGVSPWRFP